MGLPLWKRGSAKSAEFFSENTSQQPQQPQPKQEATSAFTAPARPEQIEPMEIENSKENAIDKNNDNNYGAMEIPRPTDVAVFEFGSADMFTLAGFCPVSNSVQPCRWQIIPTDDPEAPQFRIAF